MSTVVYWQKTDFLTQVLTDFIKRQRQAGSNKKQTEIFDANYDGFLDGLRHGIAAYANELRVLKWAEMMPNSEERMVPALSHYDLITWMREMKKDWDEGKYKELSDEEFFDGMRSEFMRIVFDEQFMEYVNKIRRDAIKSGRLEPGPEDAAWLREEYEAFNSMTEPLRNLLEKAEGRENA